MRRLVAASNDLLTLELSGLCWDDPAMVTAAKVVALQIAPRGGSTICRQLPTRAISSGDSWTLAYCGTLRLHDFFGLAPFSFELHDSVNDSVGHHIKLIHLIVNVGRVLPVRSAVFGVSLE